MASSKLTQTEELDFHYLLSLMPPLHDVREYGWLPELFSIIGHEKLILLSKYAGGETLRIPTLEELLRCINALQWFYDIHINRTKQPSEVPEELKELYLKIVEVYYARDNKSDNISNS